MRQRVTWCAERHGPLPRWDVYIKNSKVLVGETGPTVSGTAWGGAFYLLRNRGQVRAVDAGIAPTIAPEWREILAAFTPYEAISPCIAPEWRDTSSPPDTDGMLAIAFLAEWFQADEVSPSTAIATPAREVTDEH